MDISYLQNVRLSTGHVKTRTFYKLPAPRPLEILG